MKRIHDIQNHPIFREEYQKLQEAEKERIFCRHTMEHFLDVARLMYIYSLEHHLSASKELIYATALMHDIGRIDQIEMGIPHEQTGAALCDVILSDCGFSQEETETIKSAILHHRKAAQDVGNPFYEMLYWADKKSRNCFACTMREVCNWNEGKMNLKIDY